MIDKHVPAIFWKIIHLPIPKKLRRPSMHEEFESSCVSVDFPNSYIVNNGELKGNLNPLYVNNTYTTKKPYLLEDVLILPDGILILDQKIHQYSSLFNQISIRKICDISREVITHREASYIDSAFFIPRQFVKHGTYGDYIMEFLLPFCNSEIDRKMPLLIDASFIYKNILNESKELGHNDIRLISKPGVRVGKLYIPPCCQVFDHFTIQNLESISHRFQIKESDIPTHSGKVYLSRFGFPLTGREKQFRIISNEMEIEEFLSEKGFLIIRSHELSNNIVRAMLKNAKYIVANHGSAMFHLMWSRPKCIIELAEESWWNQCFVKLGYAIGAGDYHVVKSDNGIIDINKLSLIINKVIT
jgi:capsular polysaccharide biosynthesis protein